MDDEENDPDMTGRKPKNKVNIFDDDVSCDAARKIIKSSPLNADYDDDDFEDEINFDGTPAVKYSNKPSSSNASKAPMPDLSALATPVTSPSSRPSAAPSDMSYGSQSSFGSLSSAMAFSHNRSKSLSHPIGSGTSSAADRTSVSRPNFTTTPMSSSSSLQDIDESIGGGLRKQMTAADIDKMQSEIQTLRRSLQGAKRDRWVKLPVQDTLRRIMKGEEYSLELYKSLEDKLELLDKATHQHDGNAITAAILFLQRTVSSNIFNREILVRPVAANHYLNYLKAHFDFAEYINTLIMLGRTEEAAIFKFKLALPTSDATVKISKLKDSLRSHFQADPILSNDASLVQEYVDLLERQRPIEADDANAEAAGKSTLFRDFPRRTSLIGLSVVTTLFYCCLYHYDLSENSLASPVALKKRHQISDKQYTRIAISARSKLRQWKDVEALLTTKGWFGGNKLKAVIGFDKVVVIIHKYNAPPDILDKYLAMIDDLELRLSLAKKVSCSKSIVDTLIAMKNRSELESYAQKLDRYSKDGLYALDALNSSTIKWK